jgi:hypothetical protein
MRIRIKPDDNQNWLNWGKLVNLWIDDPSKRPDKVGGLRRQLVEHGVTAEVEGGEDRAVVMQMYSTDDDDPLFLMLPNKEMRAKRLAEVAPGLYPLPLFYAICFGGANRVSLSQEEADAFAVRRIGEYSVNECC